MEAFAKLYFRIAEPSPQLSQLQSAPQCSWPGSSCGCGVRGRQSVRSDTFQTHGVDPEVWTAMSAFCCWHLDVAPDGLWATRSRLAKAGPGCSGGGLSRSRTSCLHSKARRCVTGHGAAVRLSELHPTLQCLLLRTAEKAQLGLAFFIFLSHLPVHFWKTFLFCGIFIGILHFKKV